MRIGHSAAKFRQLNKPILDKHASVDLLSKNLESKNILKSKKEINASRQDNASPVY